MVYDFRLEKSESLKKNDLVFTIRADPSRTTLQPGAISRHAVMGLLGAIHSVSNTGSLVKLEILDLITDNILIFDVKPAQKLHIIRMVEETLSKP